MNRDSHGTVIVQNKPKYVRAEFVWVCVIQLMWFKRLEVDFGDASHHAHSTSERIPGGKDGAEKFSLPVSKWLRAAEEIKPMRRKEAATVQESMVCLESGVSLRWSAVWRTDAQTGGVKSRTLSDSLWLRDGPGLRSRDLLAHVIKSPSTSKQVSTATARLTLQRHDQIVESRDPVSDPCDRK